MTACALLACQQGAGAQSFVEQPCIITPITFFLGAPRPYRTVQNFTGNGCSASFVGGLQSSINAITVVQRPRHLTITPTSNGFGITLVRRTSNYRGPDTYGLRICGRNEGQSGCATIFYDVTIN
jgi:hypothetical protein